MDEASIIQLNSLLFNKSKSIHHVHVYGANGSGRSEIVRKILKNDKSDWVTVFSDFLYAEGSLKLLLTSLANELGIKGRGDRVEDFFDSVYQNFDWPNLKKRKIIIFLDNAQAVVNCQPATLRCFFNSYKILPDMTVRFVTCAPSSWDTYQGHIALSHSPAVQFFIRSPSADRIVQLITRCNPNLNPQFVKNGVDILYPFCNSPNTLLSIINEAFENYENKTIFDTKNAVKVITDASIEKLGNCSKTDDGVSAAEAIHSFETMPLSMKYLLLSAYCASHNAAASDRVFFVKNHGKDKRSEKRELRNEENRKFKDVEPKFAELQRILCIYESLVMLNEEKTIRGFDVKNIITSLSSMGLISIASLRNLDLPKMKCLISLESAHKIAKSLNLQFSNFLEYAN